MKMVLAQFTKVSRENQRDMQGGIEPLKLAENGRMQCLLGPRNLGPQSTQGAPHHENQYTNTRFFFVHQHEDCKTNIGTQRETL